MRAEYWFLAGALTELILCICSMLAVVVLFS